MSVWKEDAMKLQLSILAASVLLLGCSFIRGSESGAPKGRETQPTGNRRAVLDVKDEDPSEAGHGNGNDALYIEGLIWDQLRDLGIGVALSEREKTDSDLKVTCRFRHGPGTPAITPGFQIKTKFVTHCTLKCMNKGGLVICEASWEKDQKNGELEQFIRASFAELRNKLGIGPTR